MLRPLLSVGNHFRDARSHSRQTFQLFDKERAGYLRGVEVPETRLAWDPARPDTRLVWEEARPLWPIGVVTPRPNARHVCEVARPRTSFPLLRGR